MIPAKYFRLLIMDGHRLVEERYVKAMNQRLVLDFITKNYNEYDVTVIEVQVKELA